MKINGLHLNENHAQNNEYIPSQQMDASSSQLLSLVQIVEVSQNYNCTTNHSTYGGIRPKQNGPHIVRIAG
jgi:hypothetical protein